MSLNNTDRFARSILSIDKVTSVGCLLGLAAIFLPFVSIRQNRISAGEIYRLTNSVLGWWLCAVIICMAVITVLIGTYNHRFNALGTSRTTIPSIQFTPATLLRISLAGCAIITMILVMIIVQRASETWGDAGNATMRVALKSGFWIVMMGALIVMQDSLRLAHIKPRIGQGILLILLSLFIALCIGGVFDSLAIIKEFYNQRTLFFSQLIGHLALSGSIIVTATIIGIPLGIIAWRHRWLRVQILGIVSGIQTIPSLALFGLLIAPLSFLSHQFPILRSIGIRGIGATPAIIALTLYALLPIIRNTYTSLAIIPKPVIDAARGMGMNNMQLFHRVEVPLALPIVLNGIRTAAVQAVGNTTVAALIGARGLGNMVFQGLGQAAPDLVILGVIPIITIAIIVNQGMNLIIKILPTTKIPREEQK